MSHAELRHVAIILDGNRRWAKSRNLKTLDGHRKGAEVFRELSLYLFETCHIPYVTAYVFSKENWQRTEEEVSYLMKLVVKAVEKHLDEFHKKNIKVLVLGSRDGLTKPVLKAIERTEQKTAGNTGGTLSLCFNYGGKQEIVDACKRAIEDGVDPQHLTEESVSQHVYGADVPPVDLMIRTSGERRTSGFMMWRLDYAEMYFIDTYWPDMTTSLIDEALAEYSARKRRFGK